MKVSTIISLIILSIILLGSIVYLMLELNLNENSEKNDNDEKLELVGSLFNILVDENDLVIVQGKTVPLKASFVLKDGFQEIYEKIGFFEEDVDTIFVIPTFTASAYSKNGFYDFYNGYCDKQCLTIPIVSEDNLDYSSSANAVKILQLLKYDSITDLELHENPSILNKYEKVILLHNEYVSKKMFVVITTHKNVIFLYPNALYAEVEVEKDTIKLIRGHGFPVTDIGNGFNWINDNTHPYEFDNKCDKWDFYKITNGFMLNCYPEQIIWKDELFLKTIKDL